MDSLVGVTDLSLSGVKLDDAFFNIIESKFHSLESLTLKMTTWNPPSFKITSRPLKRLFINSCTYNHILVDLQVFAPKLALFYHNGMLMPRLEFPAATPEKIKIDLSIRVDGSFFIKLMETLMLSLSAKWYIEIHMGTSTMPLNIDIDDLKRRVPYPATNIQKLSFKTSTRKSDESSWEHSPFFYAFFSVCHPKKVDGIQDVRCKDKNYFCKLMVKEVIDKKTRKGYWPDYLKDVEIKNPQNRKWEKMTDSWKSFLDGSTAEYRKIGFKLNWQ